MRALWLYVVTGCPCGGLACCAGHVSVIKLVKAPYLYILKLLKHSFFLWRQKVLSLNMVSTWSSEFYQLHISESACDCVYVCVPA